MKKTKLPSVPPEVNTNWEQMLKRFCTSLSECRIIDTHISECRMLITSCRAAEAASLPGDSTRAMLAIHLHQCGFRPAHPEDLDSISADLDAIQRGNNELTAEEEKAVQAVMRIPFAVTMLPTDTEELDHTIKAIISRAKKTNRIADKLAVEFTTAGMVCDIVDAIERFARAGKKNVAKTEEICRNVYRAARRGSAAFMQDWVNNPNLQETGRQRKTGGGAKAKWDTNN